MGAGLTHSATHVPRNETPVDVVNALLPQPGGFEGLALLALEDQVDDLSGPSPRSRKASSWSV